MHPLSGVGELSALAVDRAQGRDASASMLPSEVHAGNVSAVADVIGATLHAGGASGEERTTVAATIAIQDTDSHMVNTSSPSAFSLLVVYNGDAADAVALDRGHNPNDLASAVADVSFASGRGTGEAAPELDLELLVEFELARYASLAGYCRGVDELPDVDGGLPDSALPEMKSCQSGCCVPDGMYPSAGVCACSSPLVVGPWCDLQLKCSLLEEGGTLAPCSILGPGDLRTIEPTDNGRWNASSDHLRQVSSHRPHQVSCVCRRLGKVALLVSRVVHIEHNLEMHKMLSGSSWAHGIKAQPASLIVLVLVVLCLAACASIAHELDQRVLYVSELPPWMGAFATTGGIRSGRLCGVPFLKGWMSRVEMVCAIAVLYMQLSTSVARIFYTVPAFSAYSRLQLFACLGLKLLTLSVTSLLFLGNQQCSSESLVAATILSAIISMMGTSMMRTCMRVTTLAGRRKLVYKECKKARNRQIHLLAAALSCEPSGAAQGEAGQHPRSFPGRARVEPLSRPYKPPQSHRNVIPNWLLNACRKFNRLQTSLLGRRTRHSMDGMMLPGVASTIDTMSRSAESPPPSPPEAIDTEVESVMRNSCSARGVRGVHEPETPHKQEVEARRGRSKWLAALQTLQSSYDSFHDAQMDLIDDEQTAHSYHPAGDDARAIVALFAANLCWRGLQLGFSIRGHFVPLRCLSRSCDATSRYQYVREQLWRRVLGHHMTGQPLYAHFALAELPAGLVWNGTAFKQEAWAKGEHSPITLDVFTYAHAADRAQDEDCMTPLWPLDCAIEGHSECASSAISRHHSMKPHDPWPLPPRQAPKRIRMLWALVLLIYSVLIVLLSYLLTIGAEHQRELQGWKMRDLSADADEAPKESSSVFWSRAWCAIGFSFAAALIFADGLKVFLLTTLSVASNHGSKKKANFLHKSLRVLIMFLFMVLDG